MAKIHHNNSLDTTDALITEAKNKGIIHLASDIFEQADRKLRYGDKELLNFGTCGYLGLELDQRLKDGAIDFAQKYGTQFGISRGFLSSGVNELLEIFLEQMFNKPVVTYSSTSSAHISVIPSIIELEDAVILDQQVHMSIQTASQLVSHKGVHVEMIRHSNMEMLEHHLKQMSQKHKKIWYLIDGVYSMYGDVAPMEQLVYLMDKYEELHVYVDDAHGMSWTGKNGSGYINSKVPNHEKVVLMTTMGKGFGVTGGIAVFPNDEMKRRVRIFGGPLVYSHPLAPPIIGAAIASAKIHLSDDIYRIQNELRENIDYCNELLAKTELTILSDPYTPINFIALGHPKVTTNMVKRMLDDGFFVNPALFPAVSMKNSGVRCSISRQVKKYEIKQFVDALSYHYPKVLEEENKTMEDVKKAFKSVIDKKDSTRAKNNEYLPPVSSDLFVQEARTIKDIDNVEWNKLLGKNGNFDWEGMLTLEMVFSSNPKPEENSEFYYFIIRDKNNNPILATFLTSTIIKDDMLALESVSVQIEEKRKKDPYYLTSKTLTMGTMLTEGRQCYIDKNNKLWKKAFKVFLEEVSEIQDTINANSIILRDFDKNDSEINSLLMEEGYAPVAMPNSNVIYDMNWNTKEELLPLLTQKNKKNVKTEVFRYENLFEVEYKKELTPQEAAYFYQLYLNVEDRNRGFNMFDYPKTILERLSGRPNWEFLILKLKPEIEPDINKRIVAAVWCYITSDHISPMIIGIDYTHNQKYKIYKQAIFQILKRARMLNINKAFMGLSADFEKQKYGAIPHARVAYIQTKDNYNMEVIESMAANVNGS